MNNFSSTRLAQTNAAIGDLVTSPQRVRTDEGTVEERPMEDVIRGDVYNRLDQPDMRKVPWGIAIAGVRPCDSLGTQNRDPWTPRML